MVVDMGGPAEHGGPTVELGGRIDKHSRVCEQGRDGGALGTRGWLCNCTTREMSRHVSAVFQSFDTAILTWCSIQFARRCSWAMGLNSTTTVTAGSGKQRPGMPLEV